jgi:pyruvate/2-oxoacid:ferredoxin oxidoreductase beta subunit
VNKETAMAFVADSVNTEELLNAGLYSCPGCMAALAMRHVLRALGPNTVLALTTGCWAVIDGPFPYTSSKVPLLHGVFGSAASMATGVRSALDILGKEDVQVLAWGGDGATYDIGMAGLSAAAARNENILYVCYDNEAYMNTGVQKSSATSAGARTTTTVEPGLGSSRKKNIVEIMASHEIPFAASASVGYPQDLIDKVCQAKSIKGFKFINVHTPCPTGWRVPPEQIVSTARLAVKARLYPLYRVLSGRRYEIDLEPEPVPVKTYLDTQPRRFKGLSDEDIASIQADVDRRWQALVARARAGTEFDGPD